MEKIIHAAKKSNIHFFFPFQMRPKHVGAIVQYFNMRF